MDRMKVKIKVSREGLLPDSGIKASMERIDDTKMNNKKIKLIINLLGELYTEAAVSDTSQNKSDIK